ASHAVDPAEAQRLVNRLGPRHRRRARAHLVEADQQLGGTRVVALEPRAEGRGGREVARCGGWSRLARGPGGPAHGVPERAGVWAAAPDRTGVAACGPTTVVHGRTRQRVTRPFVT